MLIMYSGTPGGIERSSESTVIVKTGDTAHQFCSLTVSGSDDVKMAWKVETNQTDHEALIDNSNMVDGKINSTVVLRKLANLKFNLPFRGSWMPVLRHAMTRYI